MELTTPILMIIRLDTDDLLKEENFIPTKVNG